MSRLHLVGRARAVGHVVGVERQHEAEVGPQRVQRIGVADEPETAVHQGNSPRGGSGPGSVVRVCVGHRRQFIDGSSGKLAT